MKKLLYALLLFAPVSAWAVCPTPLTVKDAAGTTQNISTTDDGSGNCQSNVIAADSTGANFASVVTAINSSALTSALQPIAAAPTVSASGAVTSLVLKASATISLGGVKYFHAENGTTTAGYCILYNGTTAPSTGALTAANVLAFQLLPASGFCDWTATNIPIAASAGAVVLLSSAATPFTYTTGTITGGIYGLAQ